MPIPAFLQNQETSTIERPRHLRLVAPVGEQAVEKVNSSPQIFTRVAAHALDLCVVQGVSVSGGKFFSALVVASYFQGEQLNGKLAAAAFRDGFAYAGSFLIPVCFVTFAALYFVALPFLFGRTLGLGIFGLKIVGEKGEKAEFRALVLRFAGWAINFMSLGLCCIPGLSRRNGQFFHDRWSATKIARLD